MKNDFIYAVRAFLRTPGFTIVAVLTLALGIGATTAIFSVVNAVLLRPLPYPYADRLVVARGSLPDLRDLTAASGSFDAVAIYATNRYNVRAGDGDPVQLLGGQISPGLLPLLGVTPALGRNFSAADDRQDSVILSYALWRSRFGGDPGVLGHTVDLSGTHYTIIGVAPEWFRFPSAEFQLWTSLGAIDAKNPQQAQSRALRIFTAVARLKPGVTLQQAGAETAAISERLGRDYPATNANVVIEVQSLYERTVGDVRLALVVLLGTVGLLLLIACANVANLMLARTTVREREIAIRVSLGAGRGRLLRQLATESLTLALFGGALGVLVAMWSIDLLPAVVSDRLPRAEGIRVDGMVLAFSLGATLLTAVLFGLAPALQGAAAPAGALKESGRAGTGGGRARRIRRALVVGETALAVIVLICAGLLARSFLALTTRDAGFDRTDLLTFNVQFVQIQAPEARAQAAAELMERLGALPGVETAGGATGFPPVTPQRGTRFGIEGRTVGPDQDGAYFIAATPDYFKALGAPVVRGRAFDRRDGWSAEPVALINRTLASELFPSENPVGRRLKVINPEYPDTWRTIVGVVGDITYRGLGEELQPTIYTPFAQTPFFWLYVMVRTPSPPATLMAPLRRVLPAVHPTITAATVRSMRDVVSESVSEPRFNLILVSSFAALALLLAAIGIYGVIAYSVTQRTREIGVRMALGAAGWDVLRLVLAEGVALALAGVVIGLGGAVALTRLMTGLLFGIAATDAATYVGVAALLLTVALLASYIPSRRAMRVEPVTALRAE